jgi:hypothetical protein
MPAAQLVAYAETWQRGGALPTAGLVQHLGTDILLFPRLGIYR